MVIQRLGRASKRGGGAATMLHSTEQDSHPTHLLPARHFSWWEIPAVCGKARSTTDLIEGFGLSAAMCGGTALAQGRAEVLMAGSFSHILVPTDFSPASEAALAYATDVASRFSARVSLLHIVTDPKATGFWTPEVYVPASPPIQERFLREARQRLENALTADERARFSVTIEARIGAAAVGIQDFAREQKVDLIVMGTHGRTGLAHLLLGSVAERVVRSSPCPVLTTHAAAPSSAGSDIVATAGELMRVR
jgi:universal stress protein A